MPEHRLTFNGEPLFALMLAQAPFSERADSQVCAFVEQTKYAASLNPAGLYDLAAALDGAADQIRDFADQLAGIVTGGAP